MYRLLPFSDSENEVLIYGYVPVERALAHKEHNLGMIFGTVLKSALFWPSLLGAALTSGGIVGYQAASALRPTGFEFVVTGNSFFPDVEAAMKKYETAKAKGNFGDVLTPDEMINVSYRLFSEEEHTWTQGVGASLASIVTQNIYALSVRDGDRFFEESISSSAFVSLYDRMYRQGDESITYWGDNGDFASHPKKTYDNKTYADMMGRNVAEPLIFVVSPQTLIKEGGGDTSGQPLTGIYRSEAGYVVEAELSPIYGVCNYKKQMKTISDLASQPEFKYCHLTVEMDFDLTLRRMVTYENYRATTSKGVGSWAVGSLTTVYHHEPPPFPFPSIGDVLPPYPKSL